MKVFVTGASGFVGTAVVRELLAAGHQVLGLVRSDAAAAALASTGAEVQRGTLDDLDILRSSAAASDGVIHTAFIHDWSIHEVACATDRRAIETIGETLAGSDRPFIMTSGTALPTQGLLLTEETRPAPDAVLPPRFASEQVALSLASRGVRVSVMRLSPTVHGEGDHGFVPMLINIARTKGVSAYPGDGSNHWSAVHRLDAARLYRLALEKAPAGTTWHAVADEGVPVRDIASLIGRHLNVPVVSLPIEKAGEHFGFLGPFFSRNLQASSALTQQRLDWHPTHLSLLADLDHDYYFNHEG